ncbi:hypothetical protein SAMN05518848_11328 [Paenibacillus sp. PDC88]|nr:hypothetical protein SAMN05518848_11328 [Paenibacillus sp. PDC88]SFS89497.1 hypothetical protein SAMN04488601_106149 [Paenibacillus sp. 453mf]SGI66407.1 Uncharacterised protein [Mycobacterium tuberculosis]
MEFFVRDGELAIHYHEIEVMLGTPIQQPHGCGMKRSHLITFLMMIEEQITSFTPIDYGSIIITYEMNNKGNFKAKMKFRQQVNHRRR